MVKFGSHPGPNLVNLPKNRFVPPASGTQTATDDTFAKQLVGVTISLLIALFALWLCLAILSLMGLENFDREFLPSLTMRMAVASALALILCIDGLPLIVPWFIAFLPAYFLIPGKSVLWKTWVCTLSGVLVGIFALWIDAVVYSWSKGGPMSSLNISLLESASIPAAVLGGATCLAAAASRRLFKPAA